MRLQTLLEARWIFLVLIFFLVIGARISRWLGLFWATVLLSTIYFFRDPDREVPSAPDAIVAAADGKVVAVEEVFEPEILQSMMKRIAIFLSVFDVHTNRAPLEGKIIYSRSHPGVFLDARHPDATRRNAYRTWVLANPRATLVVRQIAGAVARRIVGWSNVGDDLEKGTRFGMIRFGSRTEVYVPLDCSITVKVGDRVRGGQSVIAKLPSI
ncbi:MAG TPA: phosphatidylserine decarboxylase [Chthoniobacterales bacterium]